jgi:hypothetical protein
MVRTLIFILLISVMPSSIGYCTEGWISSRDGSSVYYTTAAESEQQYSWSGDVVEGKVHGYGVQRFYSGSGDTAPGIYTGTMENGYREGYGTFSWNAFQYTGDWHHSSFQGKGTLITASWQYYGEFLEGKRHGQGTWINAEGVLVAGRYSAGNYVDNEELPPGYFVIVLCTREQQEAMREAEEHRRLGLRPVVIDSSKWSNLAPGWYMVVYGVLQSDKEVEMLKDFKLGGQSDIKYYIKYSGKQVQR